MTSAALAFSNKDDVIEEIIGLGRRLQQGDGGGVAQVVGGVAQVLDDGKGGRGVQPCGNLVHEQHPLGAHDHLTCHTMRGKVLRPGMSVSPPEDPVSHSNLHQ